MLYQAELTQAADEVTAGKTVAHPKYRPDIDGLRAIAVLSVVGFHAFPSRLSGGFTGVDIFFVISGFLISSIIFSDLRSRTFSFYDFFGRRVRRIFPSLLVVIVACYVFGWFSLFADEFKQLGKHIAAGSAFISNIVLWSESGYFDAAAERKPLLHLWSLGIEEQFYIIWPLLAWLAWKARSSISWIIGLVIAGSFLVNIAIVESNPVAAFYSPVTRFWELLIGSSLAWYFSRNIQVRVASDIEGRARLADPPNVGSAILSWQSWPSALSVAGISLIIAALVTATESRFPGWWAVLPTVGAAMLISAGPQGWVNREILSRPILVWFGLISYPLYLWHWPLLFSVRTMSIGAPTAGVRLAAIVIAIALAALTYKFIEKPVRRSPRGKTIAVCLVMAMALVGCVGFYTYRQNGLGFRYETSPNDYLVREWHLGGEGIVSCNNLLRGTPSSFCATAHQPTIALIGDSHAGALFHGIINNSVDPYYRRAVVMGAGSCQPTVGVESAPACGKQLEVAIKTIQQNPRIKTVVLAGYQGFLDGLPAADEQSFLEGYGRTIAELTAFNKTVVFLVDNPSFKKSAEFCQPRTLPLRSVAGAYPKFCAHASAGDLRDSARYTAFVGKLKERHADVMFHDAKSTLCQSGRCPMFMGSQLLYGDNNHLSIYGSQRVADDLVRALSKLRR